MRLSVRKSSDKTSMTWTMVNSLYRFLLVLPQEDNNVLGIVINLRTVVNTEKLQGRYRTNKVEHIGGKIVDNVCKYRVNA